METLDDILTRLEKKQNNNSIEQNQGDFWNNLESRINERALQKQAELERQNSFENQHPILSGTLDVVKSIPEAGKQFGTRAVRSYPEFASGANDALYLLGDLTQNKDLANFGRENSAFWKEQADKIQIDPQYQGLDAYKSTKTFLPKLAGEIGGQATNIIMASGGAGAGAKLAGKLGLKGLAKAGLIGGGTAIPNLAQEGQYGDKIEAFYAINGRMPTEEELTKIQLGTLAEKGTNTALETVTDLSLFGKLFPQGTAAKGIIKNVIKNVGEQTVKEGLTETAQEGVSIGIEKLLGLNQGNNAERLLEAGITGGLVGGVIGGGATLISQPYNTQFEQAQAQAQKQAQEQETQIAKEYINEVEKNGGNGASAIADEIVNRAFYAPTVQEQQGGMLVNPQQSTALVPYNMNTQLVPTQQEQVIQNNNIPLLQGRVETNIPLLTDNLIQQIAPNTYEKQRNKKVEQPKYVTKEEEKLTQGKSSRYENISNSDVNKRVLDLVRNGKTLNEIYEIEKNVPKEKIEKLYNGFKNGEYPLSTNVQKTPNFVLSATKTDVRNDLKELAPNTYARQQNASYKKGDFIRDDDGYNEELQQLKEEYEKTKNNIKKDNNIHPYDKSKILKGLVMKYSARKREIIQGESLEPVEGGLTAKELEKKKKHLNSNYIGKNVFVNGKKATIVKNVFGKHKIMFENGETKVVTSDEITSENKLTDKEKITVEKAIEILNENLNNQGTFDNTQVKGYKSTQKGNSNIEEVSDNDINRSTNQTGNNRSSDELSERFSESETMVREQPELVDRNSQGNIRQNGNARTSDNVNVGIRNEFITDKHKELIEKSYKNQHELNQAIENFVSNKEYEKYDVLPDEVKNWLKKYTGAGGLEKQGAEGKGLLSEYYTPENIVKKMWEITAQYIDTNGAKVLEPSVGIGRFLEYAPENTNFDVVEMNPTSAKIAELLYPNTNVTVGEFQERFINKETNSPVKKVVPEYDIVIGNPPYGQYSGRYKGLGEGKGIARIEHYFIKRGLDTLKENGVMTFIVPSSFLDSSITKVKQEIGNNAELIDAYRLPENTFSTTSIGTDIIVLRKKRISGKVSLLNAGNWFKQHPDKILGSVETRKNRFGKEETYVKGDKNIVENINTSKKDIKQTVATDINVPIKNTTAKQTTKKNTVARKTSEIQKGNVEYTRYKHVNPVSKEELKYFTDTRVDGTLPKDKYSPNEKVNMFNGDLYNDFNYLQDDIYEKLDALETENISEKQKEIQRKKLMSVLPERKGLEQINLTPTSDFIREYPISDTYYDRYQAKEVTETTYLDRKYLKYVANLTRSERNGVNVYDIDTYVRGGKISIRYRGNPTKEEKENQRAEYLTKLKNTVDKTFNDFLNSELPIEEVEKLTEKWNRTFNNLYTPDYKKMPMIVQDLNSKFKGKDLKLQDVQVEGINFLTNKGVGLLGFEVGVGKTLSGIISTVQNMQMGRCKRPLIIVPKQVKPNWIREINEAFPNIKVNDLDNLGKFNGEIQDGTVSIATFQALDNLWYSQETINKLLMNTYEVGNDFNRDSTKRGREQAKERNEEFVGKAEKDNKKKHTFEELGFDHITVDEAHNFKNLFASAKADGRDGNSYLKITGAESTRAKRMFLATQYILSNNDNRNVFMLTATPFNNSPLEVFNMLSYIAKDKLDNMGLYNVYQFMENYVDITADWAVDSKNNVVYSQIPKAFKNLQSLQAVIDTCMLIRSAEDAKIKRPNKHTVKVILEPTQEQLDLIAKAESEAVQVSPDGKRNGGAVLRAISKARIATLSPAIYNNDFDISSEDFVKGSPKLEYVLTAIESMKQKDPTTGQLLYMPLGVDFLPKIKEYLVNKKVFKADEIAIIKSGVNDDKITEITDSFNDKNGKIKLIIGTNKMREGMNLNGHTSVLYVPYMDWNPTDYLQIVGRIWRQGNDYNNIRVVVPLLKDSSDPFLFQKLDEKTSRINNIMDRGKDYIDTAELDTAEEKINMITNPDKKATMFSQIEEQKLRNEKNKLEGQLETTKHYKKELASLESDIKGYETSIEKYEKRLETIENKESWEYSSVQSYIEKYKKDLARTKQALKYTKVRIERLELDFNGKDSEEAIQEKIKDVEKQIENLKEITEIKKAQYKDEYENNRKSGKSIIEHIKEFQKQTDELYGKIEFLQEDDIDIPDFLKKNNNENDFAFFFNGKSLKSGEKLATVDDLKNHPAYEKIKDFFVGMENVEICFVEDNVLKAFPKTKAYRYNGEFDKIYVSKNFKPEYIVHELTHIKDELINKNDIIYEIEQRLYSITNIKTNSKLLKNLQQAIYDNSIKEKLAFENQEIARKRIEENEFREFREPTKRTVALYKKGAAIKNSIINSIINNKTNRKGKKFASGTSRESSQGVQQSANKHDNGRRRIDFLQEESSNSEKIKGNNITLRDMNIDVDEILPKVKPPKDNIVGRVGGVISTRADIINPKIKHALRRFEFESGMNENKYTKDVKDFITKLDFMTPSDYAKYDLALKNGNKEVINTINKKYNLSADYIKVRNVLDNIRDEALNVGMNIGFIDEYFPRKIINASAILDEYSKSTYLKKMLRDVDPNNVLSPEDKIEKLNIALKGYNGAITASSSFIKARKIAEVTKDLNRYYKDSKTALIDYITSMNNAIETRKFFGNENVEVKQLRSTLRRKMNSLAELKKKTPDEARRNEIGKTQYKLSATNVQVETLSRKDELTKEESLKLKNLKERQAILNKYLYKTLLKEEDTHTKQRLIKNKLDEIENIRKEIENSVDEKKVDDSIGAYTKLLLDKNIIKPSDELELKAILKARFNQRGTNGLTQDIKNLGYIISMGNFNSAITQFGDLALSLYNNGVYNTIIGASKARWGNRNKISKEDLGIHKIAQEFESDRLSGKLVDKIFKIVGLEHVDSFGKETFINGAFNKFHTQAKETLKNPNSENSKKFYNKMQEIFEEETNQVMLDLVDGKVSDNVKYLLFSELSNFQPISLSEMPETYLTGGNGRILYMLKSYSIKLLDVYRNEVFRQMKTDPKQGIANLIRLTTYVALLNVGADGLKDYLLGKEFNLPETFLDNILKIAMFSKYQLDRSKQDGPTKTLLSGTLPPIVSTIDDIFRDVIDEDFRTGEKSIKDLRTIKNIPVGGKYLYWWFGGGQEVKAKNAKTDIKKDLYKVYSGKHGKKEYQKIVKELKQKGYTKEEIKKLNQQSITSYLSPYKKRYKRALEKGDKKAIQQLREELKNTNISEARIKKAMNNTYEQYLKEKKHRK